MLGMAPEGKLVAVKMFDFTDEDVREFYRTPQRRRSSERSEVDASPAPPEASPARSRVDEVLNEVLLLSGLPDHANIVRFHSAVMMRQHSQLCIIMEYLSGGSLTRLLDVFRVLPLPSVKRFARDILQGLRFLHRHGIVHRDVNPNNVLLTTEGVCKLSDFGCSAKMNRLRNEAAEAVLPVGTPAYMAPEVAALQPASPASDVWSFGVMVHHLLTGELPYAPEFHEVEVELFIMALAENMMPQLSRAMPTAAHTLVSMCLQRDPKQRPSAESLLHHPFILS